MPVGPQWNFLDPPTFERPSSGADLEAGLRADLEAGKRVVTRLAIVLSCLTLSFGWASTVPAQTTYKWSDIGCGQSRIAAWPGLRCKTTNVVTNEGNIGVFRRWAAVGTTSEGYVHVFLWEAQDSFSFLTTEDTTADFLKWMYENGRSASDFSPVARYTRRTTPRSGRQADLFRFSPNRQSAARRV